MRWVQSEYALKGLFLGLLLYTALQIQLPGDSPADGSAPVDDMQLAWHQTGRVALYMLAGLGAGIVLAVLRQIRVLGRIVKKPHAFLVFLLLENPLLIYLGLIGGLGFAAVNEFDPGDGKPKLIVLAIVGAILGFVFEQLRDIRDIRYRFGLSVAIGAGVVYVLVGYLESFHSGDFLKDPDKRQMLGLHMLLGLPFFYLLCFVGIAEESEAEIAGLCTVLGFAIYLLQFPKNMPAAGFLLPVALYFTYAVYVLPGLRVFKHTLRGYTYMEVGKIRPAVLSFRRALQLDERNVLAHQGMDALHVNIEIERVDARTLGLLDPSRCLKRVRVLLSQKPTAEQMQKALRILDLVEKLWPKLVSHVMYHRAVAALHTGDIDRASALLTDLLNPEGWFADDVVRKSILFDAWQLVLFVHPTLKQRVGEPELELPGRRMEAIAAVERQMGLQSNEPALIEFQRILYAGLREVDYFEANAEVRTIGFSHALAEELGIALSADPEQWQHGAGFLRIAADGLKLRRPAIYARLADVYAKAGESATAIRYREAARDSGLEIGLANLAPDQRAVYYTAVRRLAEDAAAREDYDEAIHNYGLLTHAPDSGIPTLRSLAEMYKQKNDIMNALRITEKALCHDGRDPDLLQRKDSYYYSLDAETLRKTAKEDDNVRKYFDVAYCVKKAKSVLDAKNADLETLDWAHHLVSLALIMQPANMLALVQKARLHLRRGEREEGLKIFEDVREMKPSGSEESDIWYFVHKQLGKLYLDELNRADLAIPAFSEYLLHIGSGAETLYDLGRAYEAMGDNSNAIKNYRQVSAYDNNPLQWEAQAAVRRLKGE